MAYMTNLDLVDIGMDFSAFEDPPPPYYPPKPPMIPPNEPPPPYEERDTNGNLNPGNTTGSDIDNNNVEGVRSLPTPNSPDLIPLERMRSSTCEADEPCSSQVVVSLQSNGPSSSLAPPGCSLQLAAGDADACSDNTQRKFAVFRIRDSFRSQTEEDNREIPPAESFVGVDPSGSGAESSNPGCSSSASHGDSEASTSAATPGHVDNKSPSLTSLTSPAPETPFSRSDSLSSHISVCSETGEKKSWRESGSPNPGAAARSRAPFIDPEPKSELRNSPRASSPESLPITIYNLPSESEESSASDAVHQDRKYPHFKHYGFIDGPNTASSRDFYVDKSVLRCKRDRSADKNKRRRSAEVKKSSKGQGRNKLCLSYHPGDVYPEDDGEKCNNLYKLHLNDDNENMSAGRRSKGRSWAERDTTLNDNASLLDPRTAPYDRPKTHIYGLTDYMSASQVDNLTSNQSCANGKIVRHSDNC